MIQWNDVLTLAVDVLDDNTMRQLTAAIAVRNFNKADFALAKHFYPLQKEVLESVYNGDCDMVIFDAYRKMKDLFDLYKEYREEQYAVGT